MSQRQTVKNEMVRHMRSQCLINTADALEAERWNDDRALADCLLMAKVVLDAIDAFWCPVGGQIVAPPPGPTALVELLHMLKLAPDLKVKVLEAECRRLVEENEGIRNETAE